MKRAKPEPPKWLVPLLAEPVEESWRKLLRRGMLSDYPTCIDMKDGLVIEVEDALRIPLGRRMLK